MFSPIESGTNRTFPLDDGIPESLLEPENLSAWRFDDGGTSACVHVRDRAVSSLGYGMVQGRGGQAKDGSRELGGGHGKGEGGERGAQEAQTATMGT